MGRGVINIVIGGILVIGASSGKMVLIGTQSSLALGILGGVICAAGVVQMILAKKKKIPPDINPAG